MGILFYAVIYLYKGVNGVGLKFRDEQYTEKICTKKVLYKVKCDCCEKDIEITNGTADYIEVSYSGEYYGEPDADVYCLCGKECFNGQLSKIPYPENTSVNNFSFRVRFSTKNVADKFFQGGLLYG